MTPLLFAAALALSPTAAQPSQPFDAGMIRPFVQDFGAACARLGTLTVAPDGVPFRKLNELPPGLLEHAVWRRVAGCPVREVVYRGQTYYVGPSIPRIVSGPAVGNDAPGLDRGPLQGNRLTRPAPASPDDR
jgi:hypothetical protein